MYRMEANNTGDAPRWAEFFLYWFISGSLKKYTVVSKKWSYKLFMGLNVIFMDTWIRIQKIK